MREIRLMIVFMISLLAVETSFADFIKYTDKDGTLCFVDDMSKVPKQYRKNIIHDDQDVPAVQTKNSRREPRQQGSASGKRVTVCCNEIYAYTINGHDLSDYLDARGYPYTVRYVMKSKDDARECAEFKCKSRADLEYSSCLREVSKDISRYMPFVVMNGDDATPWNEPQEIIRIIDKFFNVDPDSPFIWKK